MCKNHFNPIHCIIPPYMLTKLMESGNKKIADMAINTNFRSFRFRNDRIFFQQSSLHEKTILGLISKDSGKDIMQMEVYDCRQKTDFINATLLWDTKTNQKLTSVAGKNVIKGGKASWDFYWKLFGRNSIDNKGMLIKQYVHFDKGMDNENQAGALNESFSDIFGIMIKQRFNNQDVKKSNWLIGEKVMIGPKYALRSLKAPGTAYINHPELGSDPQPATMDKYQSLPDTESGDFGGVHINSGIPNFAFYVTAFNIGGYAWEKAGRIWYAVLSDASLAQNANFADVKNLTIVHAEKTFGINSLEVKAVKQGWSEAKV
jgi:Zn-dependent metalloprotease